MKSCSEVGAHGEEDEEVNGGVEEIHGHNDVGTHREEVVVPLQVVELWLDKLLGVQREPGQEGHNVHDDNHKQHLHHLLVPRRHIRPFRIGRGLVGGF